MLKVFTIIFILLGWTLLFSENKENKSTNNTKAIKIQKIYNLERISIAYLNK